MRRSGKGGATAPALVWFRHDLRLEDNPALDAAIGRGGPVIPVFIWAPAEEGEWAPGAASRWWLHHSLASLQERLARLGSRLVLRSGPSLDTLAELLAATGATAVFWNRRYEPLVRHRDTTIKDRLRAGGAEADSFNAGLLHEPWTIQNQSGKPFQVFTPFWRRCLALPDPAEPLPAPARLPAPDRWPSSESLAALDLLPRPDWAHGLRQAWTPGSTAAQAQLDRFLAEAAAGYDAGREVPAVEGTSRLSPHLHFGEISPRQVWHAFMKWPGPDGRDRSRRSDTGRSQAPSRRESRFLTELGWREFSHHLLFHFPHTTNRPLRAAFEQFPWRKSPEFLRAWQRGRTGYPIVDAGMRQLWSTGWMHNRVRMIVASFLVKDLLVSWVEGARWFWDALVDADLAQNTLGWQWSAGCGADAAPFFRIFNPASQGDKFDPRGAYVRHWVPELARLPDKWIHRPHSAPKSVLTDAGLELDRDYPLPVVNHAIAREVALEKFARLGSR